MSKKVRFFLISIVIILAVILTGLILLMGIRREFKMHLSEKYPQLAFIVGFTKIDPIFEKFCANVTCMDDDISFSISKSFNTQRINDNYLESKNKIQYNSKIKEIIESSTIRNEIKAVTGGGKIPFGNGDYYEGIYIHISDNADAIPVVGKVLTILQENKILAETIVITYEREKHVYEIVLSSDDYGLTNKEIESKVQKIK